MQMGNISYLWVMMISFIPKALDKYIDFLNQHRNFGIYIALIQECFTKMVQLNILNIIMEIRILMLGVNSYIELFDKSVFISGFCIKKEYSIPFLTDRLDGSLLFQLYLPR